MKYYIKIALQHLSMGLIIPISVVWKLQNGLSLPEAILTESIVLFATALADLPAGLIANKINNKRSLILGAFFHLLGVSLLVVGGSLFVFVLAALATGVAWAFVSGADEAYIHDDFIENKDEYKKVFATSSIVDESFTIIGMLCSSALIYLSAELRTPFVLALMTLSAHLFYTVVALPRNQHLPNLHPLNTAKMSFRKILTNRDVLAIIPIMFSFAIIYEAGRPLWQPRLSEIGISIASFGLIFALLKLASLAGSVAARFREFSFKDLLVIFSTMLVSLLVFGVSAKAISIVGLCIYLFSENYFRIYMSTVLNKLISRNRAAVLSLGSVIRNFTGALIIASAGLLSAHTLLLALLAIIIIKIPAMIYILRLSKLG